MSLKNRFPFDRKNEREPSHSLFTYYFGCPKRKGSLWVGMQINGRQTLSNKIGLIKIEKGKINFVYLFQSEFRLSTGHMKFDLKTTWFYLTYNFQIWNLFWWSANWTKCHLDEFWWNRTNWITLFSFNF